MWPTLCDFMYLRCWLVLLFPPAARVSHGPTQWLPRAVRPGDSPGAAAGACHRAQPARGCAEENIYAAPRHVSSHESQEARRGAAARSRSDVAR